MKDVHTKEDIIRRCREMNIEFIHLQFTDLIGTMKNVSIPIEQLQKALDNEIMFDGSSIDGFVRIEESDMYLYPDIDTFEVFPWAPNEARLICDIYNTEGEPFEGCPRYILKRAIMRAEKMGYEMFVGPECEFYLFKVNEKGEPTTVSNDEAEYFDLAPVDHGEKARKDMVTALKKMGFEIEASHHECGAGQHEIDFKYSDALSAADNIMTFKMVVRVVAQSNNLHATFMPKPVFGRAGSGMHLNQSLFRDGVNAFCDTSSPDGLSDICRSYVAGILEHARAFSAITNPTVNSYKRLVPGFEAPMSIAWSHKNRSPLIRIPAKRGISTRIELRSPDPSANPYLALAAVLTSGLEGIERGLVPPEPVSSNLYDITEQEKTLRNIRMLPDNLKEAIDLLKEDSFLMDVIGEHARKQFIHAKEMEWNKYRTQVTEWEIKEYLSKI